MKFARIVRGSLGVGAGSAGAGASLEGRSTGGCAQLGIAGLPMFPGGVSGERPWPASSRSVSRRLWPGLFLALTEGLGSHPVPELVPAISRVAPISC